MDERAFENLLRDVIYNAGDTNDDNIFFEDDLEDVIVKTFAAASMATYDKGLVVRMKSGEEFQVTIVQSK